MMTSTAERDTLCLFHPRFGAWSVSIKIPGYIASLADRGRWAWRALCEPSDPRPASLWDKGLRRGAYAAVSLSAGLIFLGIFWLDVPIHARVRQFPRWLLETGQWTTNGASASIWAYVFVAMAVVAVVRQRAVWLRWAAFALISMAACGLVTFLLKMLFGRERTAGPTATFHWFEYGYAVNSFPSGHSTDAGVLFMIAWLIWRPLGWALLPVTLAFASTRLLTNSHWFSDTIAGFTVGAMGTLLIFSAFVYRDHLRKPRPSR